MAQTTIVSASRTWPASRRTQSTAGTRGTARLVVARARQPARASQPPRGQPPPPGTDPRRQARSYQRASPSRQQAPEKEPFDAELLVLFGLPSLVLLIAYAFNEPKTLAVTIPLVLLIPGPRDVLLHVCSDMLRAARRARRFVSTDSADIPEDQAEREERRRARWNEQQQRRRPGWALQQQHLQQQQQRTPPPTPPPPPAAAEGLYELQPGEWDVLTPPSGTQPPPSQWMAQQPQQQQWEPFSQQQQQQWGALDHHQQQQWEPLGPEPHQQWEAQPAAQPDQHGWPPPHMQEQPRSPFVDGWPPQQQIPRSPFADGWPNAAPGAPVGGSTGTRARSNGSAWQVQQFADDHWDAAAVHDAAAWGSPARGRGPANPQALPPRRRQQQAGNRLVRRGSLGQVGVDLSRKAPKDLTPLLLRPLFALIPFLRHWGGFL